jgi:hypothetical protein
MDSELEALLRLVSEGRLTAEEAAPIAAALEEKARLESRADAGARRESDARRPRSALDALADRRLRVLVVEQGHQVVNLQIPLAAAGFAMDQVPGLSPDHRSRIVEAIQSGMTGPILEVSDGGDQVRIVIE